MGRKRVIDTDSLYFDTALISSLSSRGLHLYVRLQGLAEDFGGYEPNCLDIALQMGALRFTPKEVEKYLRILVDLKKVIPYEVKSKNYHWLSDFLSEQPLKNPSAPQKILLPPWIKCKICKYKSGKKYAQYKVVTKHIPVDYQYPTSSLPVVSKQKRNETETERETARAYGSFKNVLITSEELGKLKDRFGEKGALDKIENMSVKKKAKGYKYKCDYAALLSWERKDEKERQESNGLPLTAKQFMGWLKKKGFKSFSGGKRTADEIIKGYSFDNSQAVERFIKESYSSERTVPAKKIITRAIQEIGG